MNCLEFRREALVSPNDIGNEAQTHEMACANCAEFAEQLRMMDAQMEKALRVPTPVALQDRVIEATVAGPAAMRRRLLAFAASALATAGVSTAAYWMNRDDPLALAGIRFVIDEEANAILNAKQPDANSLERVAAQMHVMLPAQLGDVRYIGTCPFEGTVAHHVVAITPYGKVTLLLLPDKAIKGKLSASTRGLHARVVPAKMGCLAVIAASDDSTERILSYLRRA
jgi:hypothetical protein